MLVPLRRFFCPAAPSTRICARSFTNSKSGTVAPRLDTPFSTDCSRQATPSSAQEVAGSICERVVMKFEALQNGQPIKLPHVIGAEHHHRKSFGQCATLVLEPEQGLDRLHDRQPRNRVA